MQGEFQVFDSVRNPLEKGVHLVEASAGTGKTYAIAMLVLRFVAEHGFPIEKILIVTFTKAATEELRGRIRSRLVEGRDLLLGKLNDPDETLLEWAARITDPGKSCERLQLALYDIDTAGIFTIHSFCQRTLQEHALESGQLFDLELLANVDHILSEVVDDFWRLHFYPLSPLPCTILQDRFLNPQMLYESVSGIGEGAYGIEPDPGNISDLVSELEVSYEEAKIWWQQHNKTLHGQFIDNREYFNKPIKNEFEEWWQSVEQFFRDTPSRLPIDMEFLTRKSLVTIINGRKVRGDEKKCEFLKHWILPDQEIAAFMKAASNLILGFRVTLARFLRKEVLARLEKQGNMTFDDLIHRLSGALREKGGRTLKGILSSRYSAVLIDEFQDTDARQWHIFSTLFGDGHHHLYLIGDPKQAIYRFRGADIHSYFTAREAAKFHLTLEKNYRTHPYLVQEVNRLFLSRSRPFSLENMTYHPVICANSVEDGWLQQGTMPLANMVYCQLPDYEGDKSGRWTSGKANFRFLQFVVAEISRLLDGKTPVRIMKSDSETLIRPKDIAILVRTNQQAEDYLSALSAIGIPAVVTSKKSVFQTKECQELHLLLQALVTPTDVTHMKTAMSTSWFGFTGNELMEVWADETLFDGWHSRILRASQRWIEKGFLTMMNRYLIDERVFSILAGQKFAERRIANIQHLLELIQEEETQRNFGPALTLQWLRSMMQESRGKEDTELRLESDAEGICIVTMHGAKGLEFPITFCPGLWYRSKRLQQEKDFISCHENGREVADLGSEHFERRKELAITEELAEEIRLLYVALTRAKLRCYTMWADVKSIGSVGDSFTSALGYLLFPEGRVTQKEQVNSLLNLSCSTSVDHRIVEEISCRSLSYHDDNTQDTQLVCRQPPTRGRQTDWQMSSYSAMSALSVYAENEGNSPSISSKKDDEPIPVSGLPAGASFGNLIHDSLEEIPFVDNFEGDKNAHLLEVKSNYYATNADAESLRVLLSNIVSTPLWAKGDFAKEKEGFSLRDLEEGKCLKEMPFYFRLDRISTEKINEILKAEPGFIPLSYRVMQGYLTGFVDLICEYEGKYYILDYKTNYLGELLSDYSLERLTNAMTEHNYGLQYWIYSLVLHRHLSNILPDYGYKHHFGGVMYLFVRGMSPNRCGSGVFHTLPDEEKLESLSLCMQGGSGNDW